MSYYEYSRTPPRVPTQSEIADRILQLQRSIERQIIAAQSQASVASKKRVEAEKERQSERLTQSKEKVNSQDPVVKQSVEAVDQQHRKHLSTLTDRVYNEINEAKRKMADEADRKVDYLSKEISDRLKGIDTTIKSHERTLRTISTQMEVVTHGLDAIVKDIDERFERSNQEINNVKQDIESIYKRFADEDEKAIMAVKTAVALLEVVEQRTLLDHFAPDYEAQDIRSRIERLSQSQHQGAALMAEADEAIIQIMQVESHAIQEKAKIDALVDMAMTQVEKVLYVVNENRIIEQPVEGGDPMTIENEFWSEGEYGELKKELEDLHKELDYCYDNKLTKERVEAIMRRSMEIEERIIQIGAESVAKAVLSESRLETAEDIVKDMMTKGWWIKGGEENPQIGYMGGEVANDWRKGVCFVLENNLGEEITIIIEPESESQNRLIVHQENTGEMTDRKVHEQMQTIKAQMTNLGYEMGDSVAGETNIPQMGSAEQLGKAHATEKVRQQLK